jgi:CubicO group peptidase (beta-lactamase class C family)
MRNRWSPKFCIWKLSFLCVFVYALAVIPVSASESTRNADRDFSKIDAYLTSKMASQHLPGIAVAIIQGDQIVHSQGFGIADPTGRPMTSQTPMLIGSVSKSFTALAIMQLVEAGKMNLDTPVQDYLPWFRVLPPPGEPELGAEAVPAAPASARITVRHLLNQTSGLSTATGEKRMADGDTSGTALEGCVRALRFEHMQRPAGAGFEYSNANYIILGMLIQAVSEQSYEAYIQSHIFNPLEMRHSFTSQADAQQPDIAVGYRQWFGFPVAARDLPYSRGMLPAGYLISSADDLGHYLIAHLNQGRYRDVSILSPQGIDALHAPSAAAAPQGYHKQSSGAYALGWYVLTLNSIPVITHDGDTPSFHADVVLMPAGKWGLALLVNTNTVLLGDEIRDMAGGVASLLNDQPLAPVPANAASLLLYTFMIGFLAFEIFNLARLITTWRQPLPILREMVTPRARFKYLGMPLIVGLMVACWMFAAMPFMFQVSWAVMLLNQPDLSWVILSGGTLALLNGLLRFARNAWKIKLSFIRV